MKFNLTIFSIFMACITFSHAFGQNDYGKSDDEARIVLNTFVPDNVLKDAPSARKLFLTKLGQISARNGLGGAEANSNNRFIISGDLNILTKDVLPTAPPKYAVTIETTLAIGDGIDGKSFATEFVEFKGVGISEDKAFISAIKKINPRHKMVRELIENGKQKILEYYNTQCDFILKEANSLADSRNFDEAIFVLSQVPQLSKECYDTSMDLAVDITKRKFEFECQTNISKANALIASGDFLSASSLLGFYTQDMECYSNVAELLKEINTGLCSKYIGEARGHWANRDSKSAALALANINANSPCYEESLVLYKEISEKLDERYKDELAIKNRKLDNDAAAIRAVRDIGVAYGKNQPRTVTYRSIF